jgi:prolyl-tRNA editing enzyme YbaK/EbsC (Cys-tRNA(Pro) deacylase)
MSYKKIKEYFDSIGMEGRTVVHTTPTDTVEHAAQVLGCEEARIEKTMSFMVGDQPIVIAMAGDAKIDNRKYKDTFKKKCQMVKWEDVEKITGHEPGGVCPFALNEGVKVYLDVSLKGFKIVHAAAGDSYSTISLTVDELEKCTKSEGWVDVCKGWNTSRDENNPI